jgi:two-component system sensor histidine kinase BaeS
MTGTSEGRPPEPERPEEHSWRSDRGWGPPGPWADRSQWSAEMARRRSGGRPHRRRRGFGCLFGVVFLIVLASIVTAIGSLLSRVGPIHFLVVVLAAGFVLTILLRGLFGAGRALDRMLEATRRVQDGDYTVRVGRTGSGIPAIGELARGFDTMTARLETDETQRRTLLADVSHELRTPLTVITGSLEAMLDGVHPLDREHLEPILDETRVLERLVEDLRTVTLSEAGTLPLHPEPTDPDVIIGEVVRSFGPAAETAGVALVTEVTGDLPILEIDPVRIREVLTNLVANALRHTPAGGTVAIGGGATAETVTVTVRDTGAGIDPALLPHVFERFVKGGGSHGSGLGLAISRGLVEAHGGSISVVSPAGGGTTFRVVLPRTADA